MSIAALRIPRALAFTLGSAGSQKLPLSQALCVFVFISFFALQDFWQLSECLLFLITVSSGMLLFGMGSVPRGTEPGESNTHCSLLGGDFKQG